MSNDREYMISAQLPDWLKLFADEILKQGGNPLEEIKDIFKNKNDFESVEAKVKELQERIGLNKVAEKTEGGYGDDQPDEKFDKEQLEKGTRVELEHSKDPEIAKEITKDHLTETKDFKDGKGAKYYDKLEDLEDEVKEELTEKVKAQMLLNLVSLSNDCARQGKIKVAVMIRNIIKKIAEKEDDVFKTYPGIKKHIDNICQSRKGHIDTPALIGIIRTRKEKLTDEEMKEIKKYIEKKIKEEKEEVDYSRDDDVVGLTDVHLFTVKEEDDGNTEVFSKPAKI